jgi:hypothetical protein
MSTSVGSVGSLERTRFRIQFYGPASSQLEQNSFMPSVNRKSAGGHMRS